MEATLKDIIQWDVKSWAPAIEFWKSKLPSSHNSRIKCLELGSHQGGLSLWLASLGFNVTCSDLENPKEKAFNIHHRYKVDGLITYEAIDATHIPYENTFDIIIFKSVLGGIGRNNNISIQGQVIQEIHKSLKPGGQFLFAENLKGSPLHQFFRKKFTPWGEEWRYVTIEEMRQFLSIFSSYEIRTNGVIGTFGRSELQRNILSNLDEALLNHLTPDNWKYISYGVAHKSS